MIWAEHIKIMHENENIKRIERKPEGRKARKLNRWIDGVLHYIKYLKISNQLKVRNREIWRIIPWLSLNSCTNVDHHLKLYIMSTMKCTKIYDTILQFGSLELD